MSGLDGLCSSFRRIERQLDEVQQMLGVRPEKTCGGDVESGGDVDGSTAAELLGRIKRLEEVELPGLRADCDVIVAAKQDLINAFKTVGMQNRRQLVSLQMAAGVSQMPSEGVFTELLTMMNAWDKADSGQPNEATVYHIVKTSPGQKEESRKSVDAAIAAKKKKRGPRVFEAM